MPRTLLHIDASARSENSYSRSLSGRIIDRLTPDRVIRRDLSEALPHVTERWVDANFTKPSDRNAEQAEVLGLSDTLVAEIQEAGTIVIGLPIYNFSLPASLKAWIDLVCRAGVTFEYTANGPRGLLEDKRVILAVASGGTQIGSDVDFATAYLRHVMGFIGIKDVELIAADQLMISEGAAFQSAMEKIDGLAA